jgi:hypothetical protein
VIYQQPHIIEYSQRLAASFKHWTGRDLASSPEALYHAPFVVVSHGTQPDPVFCYANLAAQKLWEMDWDTFTCLPSRLSAEPDAQSERASRLRPYRARSARALARRSKSGQRRPRWRSVVKPRRAMA